MPKKHRSPAAREPLGGSAAPALGVDIRAIVDSADALLSSWVQRRVLRAGSGFPESGPDADTGTASSDDDEVWDRLIDISSAIARVPARSVAEIRAKIRLWRLLAPESTFDDEQTPDEALLCSLIEDIDRL